MQTVEVAIVRESWIRAFWRYVCRVTSEGRRDYQRNWEDWQV